MPFVVISGTNRRQSMSARVAATCAEHLRARGLEVELIDLLELPPELLSPDAYFSKPACFAPYQASLDRAEGVLTVVPEYNGSYPGVLKLFIDLLEFPRTLAGVPATFVGLAAGRWGGLRAVEHLEQVFSYREALLYSRRTFIPGVFEALEADGQLKDPTLAARLASQLDGFAAFASRLPRGAGPA